MCICHGPDFSSLIHPCIAITIEGNAAVSCSLGSHIDVRSLVRITLKSCDFRLVSVPFRRNSPLAETAPISQPSDRWRTAFAGLRHSDWCQPRLAETPNKQKLPRSDTARIGGGPLLEDSNRSRLSQLEIRVSPIWQKLSTSKTCPNVAPSGSVEDRLCKTHEIWASGPQAPKVVWTS